MQINYYNTNKEFLGKSFCQLAEKSSAQYTQTYVITSSSELVDMLDVVLWTYSRKNFLPHARITDPLPESQPILILSIDNVKQDLFGNIILVNVALEGIKSVINAFSKSKEVEKLSIINDETTGVPRDSLINMVKKFNLEAKTYSFFRQLPNATWVEDDKALVTK